MVGEKTHPPPPISTPRLAPWEHVEELIQRLDRLIDILEGAAPAPPPPPPEWPGWEPIISKLDEVIALLQWKATTPEELFNIPIRSTDTLFSEMTNWQRGKRLVFKIESTLNQAVTIQLLGNTKDTLNRATEIGPALPVTAKGNISIGPAWDDWQPYVGAKITVAVAPTTGTLTISSVIQE